MISGFRRRANKIFVLWDVTQRIFVVGYRRFARNYRFRFQGLLDLEDATDRLSRNVYK